MRLQTFALLILLNSVAAAQVPQGYGNIAPGRDTAFDVSRPPSGPHPKTPVNQPALHRLRPDGLDCAGWATDSLTPSGDRTYYADSVSTPPVLLKPGSREYPANREISAKGGRVVFRFVLDTLGRAEPCSFSTLLLTDPAFEGAAYRMVLGSKFRPAAHGGQLVPVILVQGVQFNP